MFPALSHFTSYITFFHAKPLVEPNGLSLQSASFVALSTLRPSLLHRGLYLPVSSLSSTLEFVLPKLPQSCSNWQNSYWSCFLHNNETNRKKCFEIWIFSRFLLNWNRSFWSFFGCTSLHVSRRSHSLSTSREKSSILPVCFEYRLDGLVSSFVCSPHSRSSKRSIRSYRPLASRWRSIDRRNRNLPNFKPDKRRSSASESQTTTNMLS